MAITVAITNYLINQRLMTNYVLDLGYYVLALFNSIFAFVMVKTKHRVMNVLAAGRTHIHGRSRQSGTLKRTAKFLVASVPFMLSTTLGMLLFLLSLQTNNFVLSSISLAIAQLSLQIVGLIQLFSLSMAKHLKLFSCRPVSRKTFEKSRRSKK